MLGTIIFEGSGESDVLQLLFGQLPVSVTGPALSAKAPESIPVSPHYARSLADLAHLRGFDGYLLNVECPLRGGPEQARALTAWIDLLRYHLKTQVGEHAEVIWYDSVIYTGELAWQDRLNNNNVVFYPPSTGFFTNYTWPPIYPALTAQYAYDLNLPGKVIQDIHVGIDVWGRNQYGDGGFGTYRALTQVSPSRLGLSVALFGQAWTWETTEEKPNWTWDSWWKYDRMLWLGPEDPKEVVPVLPLSDASLQKQAFNPEVSLPGPFVPIVSYFENLTPPNPFNHPFITFFSPGIGFKWFVEGRELMDTHGRGWTDVQKQTSLGNLVWPRPDPGWEEGGGHGEIPLGSTSLDFADAWLGGSSVKVILRFSGDEEAHFRHFWLPLQSISISPSKSYDVALVYKSDAPGLDFETALAIRSIPEFELTGTTTTELESGWTELRACFVSPKDDEGATEIRSAVGIVTGFAAEDPSQPCRLSINIGMLSVYPSPPRPPSKLAHHKPKVLWASYLRNLLTWEVAAYFNPIPGETIRPQPPDSTELKWEISPADTAYPKFMFFNIYVEAQSTAGYYRGPEHAAFIGTTGWDGRENRFYVEDTMLPAGLVTGRGVNVRLYVQGVTDRGEIPSWVESVFVEAVL